MLRKIHFCFIGILLVSLALFCFHSEAYAEQLNKSVKDCLEQPDSCGENEAKAQSEKTGNDNAANDETATVGLTIWDFVKMIFATLFVVALLYFVLKFVHKKGNLYKSSHLIENLGGTTLGSNRSVQVIKIGNHLLVVGVGENIQLLKEIDDEEEFEQILSVYNNKLDQLVQPRNIVENVIKKVKGNREGKDGGSNLQFQSLLKKQLDELSKGRKKIYEEVDKKKGSDKQ